jgi:DNA-binding IclR family transcriptional regulator
VARSSPQTERLVLIFDFLSPDPNRGRTLADIARYLELDKATCLPMLQELVRSGWLVRDPTRKTYRIGPALVPLGRAAMQSVDVVDAARPHLHELAARLEVAVHAVIPSGDALILADLVQPPAGRRGTLGLRIGDRFPLRAPLGSSFIAWADDTAVEQWLGRHDGPEADEARERFDPVLGEIRKRGFVVEQDPPEIADVLPGASATEIRLNRRLRAEKRSRLADRVLVGALIEDETYTAFSVNAPVFGLDGTVSLALCAIMDPPVARSGAELAVVGENVRAAAEVVTRQIGAGHGLRRRHRGAVDVDHRLPTPVSI